MLIAHITDFHLQAGRQPVNHRFDTAAALEACVAHLNGLDPRPDVVVATGDLVNDGCDDDYAVLTEIVAVLKPPLFVIPGNHDDRGALRRAFAGQPAYAACDGWIQYAVEDWPVRLLALDTVEPGAPWGRLCPERLHWLDARLAQQLERPTVLFLHHPPFATGIRHMDAVGLRDGGDALTAVVARHGQVEGVLCGHVHRSIQTRWAGTIASTAPSTSHQIALDLDPETTSGYVLEPPACHLHAWTPGGGLVTHVSYVGAFDGPFPFGFTAAAG